MSDFSSSPVQIFLSAIVFVFGMVLSLAIRKYFKASVPRVLCLYLWHSIFCLIYIFYVVSNGGDALMYYQSGLSSDFSFSLGTSSVRFLSYFLVQYLGLSFLGCSFFFNVFGFIGLLAFDAALREVTWYKSRTIRIWATLIVFLPSISFWSSGLGKDSLSFLAVGLALWSALDLRHRWFLLFFSLLVMMVVRPHMAGILGLGLAGSYGMQRSVPVIHRFVLGGIAIAASAVLVPMGLSYAGLSGEVDAGALIEYVENRQGMNLSGGSSVDIADMNIFMKLFTYMFRPLFLDANGIAGLASSVDNIILLLLFIAGSWAILRKRVRVMANDHNRMFLWLYSAIAWVVLASVTANLGIALRQKWMFVPMLIFLFLSVIGRSRVTFNSKQERVVARV